MLLIVLATSVLISIGAAAPVDDLITDLPGLSWKPNFKQYSGYLQASGTKQLHYWYVESSSNPQADPLVLWLNGGPGCSSLLGLITENGPYRVSDDGKNLNPNPYSWNQVANMIFLEAPAGVGFSYSPSGNYSTDDDQVARDNLLALEDFFKKFPELTSKDFYISGESYGGIYIPTLVDILMNESSINLKGFVVGNGLSSDDMNDNSLVYFAYYHGLIGSGAWEQILDNCCHGIATKRCDFVKGASNSTECMDELNKVQQLVWASGLDVYNLYSECAGGVRNSQFHYDTTRGRIVTGNFGWSFSFLPEHQKLRKTLLHFANMGSVDSSPPCVDSQGPTIYLNRSEVRQALHIPDNVQDWQMCSTAVQMGYQRIYTTMAPQYQRALKRKLRILVYNGDVDMACNFLGDEWFVDSLHPENPQKRTDWFYKAADGTKQVGGFYKDFTNIRFLTVKGSGHMVPTDKPIPALKMFMTYIQDVQP